MNRIIIIATIAIATILLLHYDIFIACFNIMLYETDTKISKIYNCNVIKSNEIILDFVNKHDICDETLMYILFNIF